MNPPPPPDSELARILAEDAAASRELSKLIAEQNKLLGKSSVRGSSNRPYYRENYAIEFKTVIDNLVSTRATQVISADPDQRFDTHRNRISQATAYLRDNLDPEKYYSLLLSHIAITHDHRKCVTYLRFKSRPLIATTCPEFFADLTDFVRLAKPNEIFERTGLDLDDATQEKYANFGLSHEPRFIMAVTKDSLKMARLD